MAHLSGKDGRVTSEATTVEGVTSWSIDAEADVLDATDYQSAGISEYVPGNKRWSGTFEFNFDNGQDPSADPPNLNEGETVALELILDHNVPLQVSGDAIIQTVTITTPQPELITFTVAFQGTGALTKALATP